MYKVLVLFETGEKFMKSFDSYEASKACYEAWSQVKSGINQLYWATPQWEL